MANIPMIKYKVILTNTSPELRAYYRLMRKQGVDRIYANFVCVGMVLGNNFPQGTYTATLEERQQP